MIRYANDGKELAWVVGIIEGEGWIGSQKNYRPRIVVDMTDHDVIQRLHDFLGGTLTTAAPRNENCKQSYRWSLNKKLSTVPFLEVIKMYMSKRRAERIQLVLNKFYGRGF